MEPATLISPRKAVLPAQARWTRVPAAARGARTAGIVVGGVAISAVVLIVPPHVVLTAIVLVLTALAAYVSWGRALFLQEVAFDCTCGQPARIVGRHVWSPDLWVRCPACAAPWRVEAPVTPP